MTIKAKFVKALYTTQASAKNLKDGMRGQGPDQRIREIPRRRLKKQRTASMRYPLNVVMAVLKRWFFMPGMRANQIFRSQVPVAKR